MQQISAQLFATQGTTAEATTLPFTFGMPIEQANDFNNILQQTITDLQSGEISDAEFAEQLANIKQNIPTGLMAKPEKEPIDTQTSENAEPEDEILATIFAVLNLIDNIVENIDQVETKTDLKDKMTESGISDKNIDAAFAIIDMPIKTKATEYQPTDTETTENNIKNVEAQPTNVIEKIKNIFTATSFLSEDIIKGKNITAEAKPEQTELNKTLATENTTSTTNAINNAIANTENTLSAETAEQTAKDSKLIEMLKAFKDIKETASNEGLKLDTTAKATKADTAEQAPTTLETTNTKTETIVKEPTIIANQAQSAATKNSSVKTNEEINKSEFKELASKFIASLSESSTEETTELSKTETVSSITATHTLKGLTTNTDSQFKINNFNQINIEATDTTNADTAEVSENKPAPHSLNMQLYKMAQEANIQGQINLAIKNFKSGNQQVKVKLNPEELGSVTIEMEMVDNMARGVITVEKPEVAQHLAQNLHKMFDGFKQSGFNVDPKDIVIQVDDKNKQQQQFSQKDSDLEQEIELDLTEEQLDIVL